jgi:hypothetical protein
MVYLQENPILGAIMVCLNLYGNTYFKVVPIEVVDRLVGLGFIQKLPTGFEFTAKGNELFRDTKLTKPKAMTGIELRELANAYRELFPAGVKSGGYYVRTPLKEIEPLLDNFIAKYKYTPEQILEATKVYVDELKMKNYAYMQTASYFINKNQKSSLASAIENLGIAPRDVAETGIGGME